MTRENKLALVVGFGLILFVGILISDHFSVVRSQNAANLTNAIDDPLLVATSSQQDLIDLSEGPKTPPPAQPQLEPVGQGQPESIAMGVGRVAPPKDGQVTPLTGEGPQPQDGMAQNPETQQTIDGFIPHEEAPAIRVEEFVFHDVRSGETLYSISKQHMGSNGSPEALADFNNIDDPGSLRIGQRLRIPIAVANEGDTTPAVKKVAHQPRVTYTVKDGDSLSVIARRFLGSKDKWKKLYDMNRDVIDDPDNVKVGTVLRVS